jgi:hypothetical protein
VEEREVRASTIACALEGWGESGVRVRVRADVAGRYLSPPLDSALEQDPMAEKNGVWRGEMLRRGNGKMLTIEAGGIEKTGTPASKK